MAVTRQTVVAKTRTLVGDAVNAPGKPAIGDAVDLALLDFSRYANFDDVEHTFTGDGSDEYDLPATWVEGISVVRSIHYWPSNDTTTAPTVLQDNEWQIEDRLPADGTSQIRFNFSPTSADRVVMTYTALHTHTDSTSTIAAEMEMGLAYLAASRFLHIVAVNTSSTVPQNTDGDFSAGFGTAGDAYRRMANKYEKEGDRYLGISREADVARPSESVVVTRSVVPGKRAGRRYLTHGSGH